MQRAAAKNVKAGLVDAFVRPGRQGKGCEKKECGGKGETGEKEGGKEGIEGIAPGSEKEKEKGYEEMGKENEGKIDETTKPDTNTATTPLSATKPSSISTPTKPSPPTTCLPSSSNPFSKLDSSASPKPISRSSITPPVRSPTWQSGSPTYPFNRGKTTSRAASAEEKGKDVLGEVDGNKRVVSGGALGGGEGKEKRVGSGGAGGGVLADGVGVGGKGEVDAKEKRKSDKFDAKKKVFDSKGGKK
jgi:hypothetical protein